MRELRYLEGVSTLKLDHERCNGCRACIEVCPHDVFSVAEDRRMRVRDLDACMECGACSRNCPTGAISLKPGVGCASAIVHSWVFGGEPTCGCGEGSEGDSGSSSGCC